MPTEPSINSNIEILHEDNKKIIVSKSGDCPVHEGGLYIENCLTRILEKKLGYRVYPVYRLDRETSGIVVFSKNNKDVKEIFDSITEKEYTAICKGNTIKQIIDKPIGECAGENIKWKKCIDINGKKSTTIINNSENHNGFCILKITPKTGRQHQIRVHLESIGCPIIGDKIYGESDSIFADYIQGKNQIGELISRQALHLGRIVIDKKQFTDEMPEDMKELIERLAKD